MKKFCYALCTLALGSLVNASDVIVSTHDGTSIVIHTDLNGAKTILMVTKGLAG